MTLISAAIEIHLLLESDEDLDKIHFSQSRIIKV